MITIEHFKQQCIDDKSEVIVQKYLIENPTYFFDEIKKGEEYSFKKSIANILKVHIRDIAIVGSGKLGFSLKPDDASTGSYSFKKFDHDFEIDPLNKKSDVDIAIISSYLFDKEIENLYKHMGFYKDLKWSDRNNFGRYVLKGRLAVRFLPVDFPLTKEISQVQEKYQMEYGREINIEIYKSWYYFESYHQENIKNIQVNLISEI